MNKIMYVLDVLYYHYYLFYSKTLREDDPQMTTTLSFSFLESLFVNGIIDTIALASFCYKVEKWFMVGVAISIILLNYRVYHRKEKFQKIMKEKPLIRGSRTISIIITWLFFLLTVSWLFWGSIYGKEMHDRCKEVQSSYYR